MGRCNIEIQDRQDKRRGKTYISRQKKWLFVEKNDRLI
jgi:hypothetical protein